MEANAKVVDCWYPSRGHKVSPKLTVAKLVYGTTSYKNLNRNQFLWSDVRKICNFFPTTKS